MFGILRLLLALLVVAAHCELPHHINLGVSAVIVFFLLSGYVMTATIHRYYNGWERYGGFILDRAGRIFPQYLFWLALTVGWLFFVSPAQPSVAVQAIMENMALFPLMFVVYDLKPIVTGTVYISQAWSLSLEWCFYMLMPPALLLPSARYLLFFGSFIIFTLAALNLINPYNYGYHLLPGVFFIFLIGSFIFDEAQNEERLPVMTLWSLVLLVALGICANALLTMEHEWTREVLVGLLAGIPLVFLLSKMPTNRVDSALGNISYGVFLNHNLVLAVIYKVNLLKSHWAIFVWAVVGSIPLAILSYYLIELPFYRLRRRKRERYLTAY